MSDFGNVGHARGAHLALIQGGGGDIRSTDTNAARAASSTLGTDPVVRVFQPAVVSQPRTFAGTGYTRPDTEGARSRHELGVRAVAREASSFDEALLDMVRASGVKEENAESVMNAILGNPALKAQAERAFQRARIDAV